MRAKAWIVVLAATLLLAGCGWFGPPAPVAVPPGPRLVDAPYACPHAGATTVATPGSKRLPRGAIAAKICAVGTPTTWLAPHDDLTTGVDRLVRLVDHQPITSRATPLPSPDLKNAGCGAPTEPPFALILRYRHGTRTVWGNAVLCGGRTLQVGQGVRTAMVSVWVTYLRLLDRQRRQGSGPRVDTAWPAATCPRRHHGWVPTPVFDLRTVVAARVCALDQNNHPLDHAVRRLGSVDLRVLLADLATRQPRKKGRTRPRCNDWRATPHYEIAAVDSWGDRSLIYGYCATYYAVRLPSADGYFSSKAVRELPATRHVLVRLLGSGTTQ